VIPYIVSLAVVAAAVAALALAVAFLYRQRAALRQRVDQGTAELERLQRSFARFAPPELVERIVGDRVLETGERREVTVMFADIRGFTRICEGLDPALVIEMLNGYFSEMSNVIRSHHGLVTRLMGDGIMSVFGALEPNPWHTQDAVEAAIGMREALGRYNDALSTRSLPQLHFGIGIHCGAVVAGLVGSDELLEFTVMGDVVNVASRVEGLTRRLDADILVTEEVKSRLGDRFSMNPMPPAPIRGKSDPVLTWAVDGGAEP
jgi:class 3 adenylate cyclase